MFNKTYELSLNKNYVMHWGLLEAIRELLQNSIDSESPFNYEFVMNDDRKYSLVLRSEFTTLSPKTLLLGATTKRDSDDSIGSFGEGYKIALLVLTRLGYRVDIANGDKHWTPAFKHSNKFEEDMLVIYESPLSFKNSGLSFEIGGLGEEAVEDITESCLHMQKKKGEIKSTYFGDILIDKPGLLYVGGLFICKTCLKFGYDIKPKYIKLERDRQTVSSWDLNTIAKDMWFETKEFDKIAELIDEECEDVSYAKYYSPELVKEACYKLFKKQNPGAVVAENKKQLDDLVSKGMEKVVIVGGVMYSQVANCRQYVKEEKVATESIHDYLERWLGENKYHMHFSAVKAFKIVIELSKNWRK